MYLKKTGKKSKKKKYKSIPMAEISWCFFLHFYTICELAVLTNFLDARYVMIPFNV